jgi:hypothetical protein
MNEWSDLPNAALIDWVISDVAVNHSDWDDAYSAAGDAAYGAAWGVARTVVVAAARNAVRYAARYASYSAAWEAAGNACLALIAYDRAGKLFDIPVEQVEVIAHLGQPAAILMLPACRVREKRRLCIND